MLFGNGGTGIMPKNSFFGIRSATDVIVIRYLTVKYVNIVWHIHNVRRFRQIANIEKKGS